MACLVHSTDVPGSDEHGLAVTLFGAHRLPATLPRRLLARQVHKRLRGGGGVQGEGHSCTVSGPETSALRWEGPTAVADHCLAGVVGTQARRPLARPGGPRTCR